MLFYKDRYIDLPTVIFNVAKFKLNHEKKRFEFKTNDTALCEKLKDMGYSVDKPVVETKVVETKKATEKEKKEKASATKK